MIASRHRAASGGQVARRQSSARPAECGVREVGQRLRSPVAKVEFAGQVAARQSRRARDGRRAAAPRCPAADRARARTRGSRSPGRADRPRPTQPAAAMPGSRASPVQHPPLSPGCATRCSASVVETASSGSSRDRRRAARSSRAAHQRRRPAVPTAPSKQSRDAGQCRVWVGCAAQRGDNRCRAVVDRFVPSLYVLRQHQRRRGSSRSLTRSPLVEGQPTVRKP